MQNDNTPTSSDTPQHPLPQNHFHHNNDTMLFLYNAIKLLRTSRPLCERFLTILQQLETVTPLCHFKIHFYESEDPTVYQTIDYNRDNKLDCCQNQHCSACLKASQSENESYQLRTWQLHDKEHKYGLLFAKQPQLCHLSLDQEQLVTSLVEQMAMTITLERQIEQQKQLLLMQERSAMARELHDSIAQSLSCLKIHVSCLQMQDDLITPESKELLQMMRKELNTAYSQLRELITSFKLQINHTNFYTNLLELIEEFNHKLGFDIQLRYEIPLNMITTQHAFHLLQIVREALNNIYKHAKANHVGIIFSLDENQVISLFINDNGIGFQHNNVKNEHYGLTIMQDRTELLGGFFAIDSQINQGTTITVSFKGKSTINLNG